MGTSANRTSTQKTALDRTNRAVKNRLQKTTARAMQSARWIVPTVFVWCRDHLLSIAVLLMFPVAIAGYYWNNVTSEATQPPEYFRLDESKEVAAADQISPSDEPPLRSVTPEMPMTLDAPQTFNFPIDSRGAELSALQPLPMDTEAIERLSQTEQPAPLLGMTPTPADSASIGSSANCVWLTGAIEEMENATDHWENASRVQELTTPYRN